MRIDILEKSLLSPLTHSSWLALLVAVVTGVASGQGTLALSSGNTVQGGTIPLTLSLTSPVASAPAGVQWTLTYAAGNIASIGAVAGSSATAAGKTITCFSSTGSYTCLLSGMGSSVIQNGPVATINVTMTSTAATTPVGLTSLAGASGAGSSISVTGTGGTITLSPPAQLPAVTGLSCNPTSLGSGASSTCTVALSGAAPSGGATVNLSATGALSVAGSVTVPSGSATATFTATAGTISATQTAAVTATYNGSSQTASISLVVIPAVFIDSPATGATVSGTVTVSGWAIDSTWTVGTAIGSVQVLVDGTAVGTATYGLSRPDVCAVYPGRPGCPFVGFSYSLNTASLAAGSHIIKVIATDSDSTPDTGSACATIFVGGPAVPPSEFIDSPASGATVSGTITVSGWAIDNTSTVGTAIGSVQVLVDGTAVGTATYGVNRPDVCAAYPNRPGCPKVGYTYSLNTTALTPGSHTIAVKATDAGNTPDTSSTSVTVTVTQPTAVIPTVFIDSPVSNATVSGTLTLAGWAIDNNSMVGTAISTVQVLVDGAAVGTATYGVSRPDVCAVYPGRPGCPNVGYTYALNTAALTAGLHTITVKATDSDSTPDTGSTSVTVTVAAAGTVIPTVFIDSPASGAPVSGTVTVSGWAIDNKSMVGTAISSVKVLVDGTAVGTATYGVNRADVCAVYPGRPGCPYVGYTYSLNTTSLAAGSHTITVKATDAISPPDTGSASVAVIVTAGSGAAMPAVDTAASGSQPAPSPSDALIDCSPDPDRVGALGCAVSLVQAAPAGGVTVALQANTSRVQVPAQVQIPAGALAARFVASILSSDQDAQAQITASVHGASTMARVPIVGIRPISLSCAPQTVPAGGSFTCTVGMNNPNVLQVARLSVASNGTNFQLPSPFTTRPAQAQLSFEVFTTPAAAQQSSTVSVQFGQTTVSSSVTVTPANAPVLSLPGKQLAAFGKPLPFAVSAVDPGGLPVRLSAANLPTGATFDPATGAFQWTPEAPAGPIHSLAKWSPVETRSVTFTATNSAQISSTGSVVIDAGPGLPVITDLRNAANQQAQTVAPKAGIPARPGLMSCSPGSVASLLGRWLAEGAQPTSDPTGSSTQLAGTEVLVNGNPAPVVFASTARVDFVCPEAVSGGELEISARLGGATSNLVRATQQATLGLYSADGTGQGQGMVLLSSASQLASQRSYLNAGQPAEPGDTISILATGPGFEISQAPVQISIGGVLTTADQVQRMPGMAGVYQIEVTVPPGVAPGDAVPIVMQVTDSSGRTIVGNTVTIAVEAR